MEIPAPQRNRTCGDAETKCEPGKEKLVEVQDLGREKKLPEGEGKEGPKREVGKHREELPRKATIDLFAPVPKTDTGG